MQIVIDITEDDYIKAQAGVLGWLGDMIMNGTPLPKGHGRLKDADVLDDVIMQMNENGAEITRYEYKVIDNVLFEMPTIIDADTESGGQA